MKVLNRIYHCCILLFAPLTDSLLKFFTNPSMENSLISPGHRDCGRRAKVFVWALWVGNQQSKTFAGPKKVFEMKLDQFKILQNHQFSWSSKNISRFVKSYRIFLATWHQHEKIAMYRSPCGTPSPKMMGLDHSPFADPFAAILVCGLSNALQWTLQGGSSAMLVEVTSIHSHSISKW